MIFDWLRKSHDSQESSEPLDTQKERRVDERMREATKRVREQEIRAERIIRLRQLYSRRPE